MYIKLVGMLSYFISYRFVFYCSAAMSTILCIFSLRYFWNVESKLLQRQADMSESYIKADYKWKHMKKYNDQDGFSDIKWINSHEYRFPICVSQLKNTSSSRSSLSSLPSSTGSVYDSITEISNLWNDRNTRYEISLVFALMIIGGLLICIEATTVVYFSTYMKDLYDINVMISTLQVATFAFTFLLGTEYIKYLTRQHGQAVMITQFDDQLSDTDQEQPSQHTNRLRYYDFTNKFIIISLASLFAMISLALINTYNFNLNKNGIIIKYWISITVYGIIFATSFHSVEVISVELMPKSIASSVSGAKTMTRISMKGTLCLIIGVLWQFNPQWLWYAQIACQLLSFIILLAIASVELFVRKRHYMINQTNTDTV